MGKTPKADKAADALSWLHDDIDDTMREQLKKALITYCREWEVDLQKRGKPAITLKQKLGSVRALSLQQRPGTKHIFMMGSAALSN